MAKIFLDTEFIAGFHKPYFGKKRHFIDLISIGLVDDLDRTYYAISNEFNYKDADDWVKENVLQPLVTAYILSFHGDQRNRVLDEMGTRNPANQVRYVQEKIGKSNKTIAEDLRWFVYEQAIRKGAGLDGVDKDIEWWLKENTINFYGYYADYDWVLFCSLFGTMMDLPTGFPQFCRDLKQVFEEKGLSDEWKHATCPDPVGEHNALVDAQWNKKYYEALTKELPLFRI